MQNDKLKVLVNFKDPDITELFEHIVRIHGALILPLNAYTEADKIVTELSFYNEIPVVLRGSNCLIVGNEPLSNNVFALSLSRPLDESKINSAMTRLLA
jgi:hypothetical protein